MKEIPEHLQLRWEPWHSSPNVAPSDPNKSDKEKKWVETTAPLIEERKQHFEKLLLEHLKDKHQGIPRPSCHTCNCYVNQINFAREGLSTMEKYLEGY